MNGLMYTLSRLSKGLTKTGNRQGGDNLQELYKNVLEETKKSIESDKKVGSVGFAEETHRMIDETIRLYNCLRSGIVTGSELFSPDDKEIGL